MIERYTNPEMGSIWTEDNKYRRWLDVEIAVCEAWTKLGKIPASAVKHIKDKAGFEVKRIEEIEKVVKHDIIAFLSSVAEKVGEDSRFIHLGLTSYDVVDTALSLLIRESLEKIRKRLVDLKKVLRREALKHKKTICMGRTHGIHAEPVTFGFKVLVWYAEIIRHLDRVDRAIDVISVGRISGSVGTYIHLDPRVEVAALKKLGLRPAPVSTQVLQRDRHAEVLSVLALIASTLEKFAVEIRHLSGARSSSSRSRSRRARKARPPCPTRRIPSAASGSPDWPASSGATSRSPSRISPSGMSGTSPTPRPSGSFSRIPSP